jgi:hypothetical protein
MNPVSDHAILRFLERECGLDVEGLRDQLAEVTARGIAAGAPIVKWGGARFLISGGVVVTVLPRGQRPRLAHLKRAMRGRCADV